MLDKLKKIALSLVEIPAGYQLMIEDYLEGEDGSGEAIFSWTNEEEDEGISLSLDAEGNLLRLSVEKEDNVPASSVLSAEEARARAEQFLKKHYPEALNHFILHKTKDRKSGYAFHYEQFVQDVPVEGAGCFIVVGTDGEVSEFHYKGARTVPGLPQTVISKEKLKEFEQTQAKFPLTISYVNSFFHDVKKDGLRLVYAPELRSMHYKAACLEPFPVFDREEDVPEYVPLSFPARNTHSEQINPGQLIGITETMEVLREIEMEEEKGIVWREKDWEDREEDLSIQGFIDKRNAGTVKALFSKKTGELRSFIWFKERNGQLHLNRAACYDKALEFLQKINPNYDQCLQLAVTEEESDGNKEVFEFRVHNGHGIPAETGFISVVVNRTTGLIDAYMGPSFDIEELFQVPSEAAISEEEAKAIFFEHLDYQLKWAKNYEEKESYQLEYQACNRFTGTPIRYIDAITGEVISDNEP